jgi:hypothetical protein
LAALRDLRVLRDVAQHLRKLEADMGQAAAINNPKKRSLNLRQLVWDLEALGRFSQSRDVSLFYRTARAGYYFAQMKNLLHDLGVAQIPDWQSYEQFVRRRLYTSLEFTSGLGQRVLDLWTLARSRAEVAEESSLRWLQKAAQWTSLFLLPPAFADLTREVFPLWDILHAVSPCRQGGGDVFRCLENGYLLGWAGDHNLTLNFWTIYAIVFAVCLVLIFRSSRGAAARPK